MQGLHLHFDLQSGAAGDMLLAALLDLGVPVEHVRGVLVGLPVRHELRVTRSRRGGLVGNQLVVHEAPHDHDHVSYREIRAMLCASSIAESVRDLALKVFDLLADVEGSLHGVAVSEVAFHEVGAVDSIIDIVGIAAALVWLAPSGISASAVAIGGGTVRSQHGILPVPAPATLELLRRAQAPVVSGGVDRELCTPTGAAVLAANVAAWGAMPPLVVHGIGYGAGQMELADRPNVVRALIGHPLEEPQQSEEVWCIETNLDDMQPELCEYVTERLFAQGALDVWWTPITMKKLRPAFMLGVLCAEPQLRAMCAVVFAETTTIGLRYHRTLRSVLERRIENVSTPYGEAQVKISVHCGKVCNVAPEYRACLELARRERVPLKEIYAAAVAAYRARSS